MNDETKADLMKRTREWLQSCVNAATRSGVPEEADLEAFLLAHIDGEQARLDARAEEVREACARYVGAEFDLDIADARVRRTPLTSTPLADQLRDEREVSDSLRAQLVAAEARVAELERDLKEADEGYKADAARNGNAQREN